MLSCNVSTGVRYYRKEPRRSSEYLKKRFRGSSFSCLEKAVFPFSVGQFLFR
jgi:hypothetical protein